MIREDDGMDLVEFLKARLDEDEAAAKAWLPFGNPDTEQRFHVARHDPGRVLAEVDAKRRIIRRYEEQAAKTSENAMEEDRAWTLEPVLSDLALPYADHPDHRDEWRP